MPAHRAIGSGITLNELRHPDRHDHGDEDGEQRK